MRRSGPGFGLVLLVLTSCKTCRPGDGDAPKDAAPDGPTDAAQPVDASASGSTGSNGSSGRCSMERGFRGTVGPKAEVLARLERVGSSLNGHYLYTRIGIDLALTGTLLQDGALALAEGDPQNPSGRFVGTCDADGHLRGRWTKAPPAGEPLPFDLAPIEPRDEMIVATRRKTRRFPPRPAPRDAGAGAVAGQGFAFEPKEACVDEVTWPEIFGARSPQEESIINRALTNDAWVLPDKASDAQLRACVVGERASASRTFEVVMNRSGIFAVRERDLARYEGGTHPWDPGLESWLAFDTRTGEPIAKRDLLPSARPGTTNLSRLLDRCVVAFVEDTMGGDAGALADVRERVNLENLALLVLPTDRGLHFAATGYAPTARVFEGEGPTIAWSALVAAGALPASTTSAASRAWAGVAPGKASDEVCVKPPPSSSPSPSPSAPKR